MRPMLRRSFVIAFLAILAGCNHPLDTCDYGGGTCSGRPALSLEDGGTPTYAFSPAGASGWTLDFGTVSVGVRASATILLQNYGCALLVILSSNAPSDSEFTMALPTGEAIEPNGCPVDAGVLIPVTFTPSDAGAKDATATFQTDSQSLPTVTLTLTGMGVN